MRAVDVKQVIVIRRDLGMRRGKEIAQGAHASMAWLTGRLRFRSLTSGAELYLGNAGFSAAEREWLNGSFTKVTVQVDSEEELLAVMDRAREAGVEAHLVTDAGRTEFGGVPTNTAVAVGPDWSDRVDKVTGELRLY